MISCTSERSRGVQAVVSDFMGATENDPTTWPSHGCHVGALTTTCQPHGCPRTSREETTGPVRYNSYSELKQRAAIDTLGCYVISGTVIADFEAGSVRPLERSGTYMSVSLPNRLVTGIRGIDDQHRALIHWAKTINSFDAANGDLTTLERASQFLISYARFHFVSEEHAMATSGYEEIAQHRLEHGMLRKQLAKMSETISNQDYGCDITTICALQGLVRMWIQNHISASDMAFARYVEKSPNARHVELPSPSQLQSSGVSVADIEQVEAVHNAGEFTKEELPSRLF